MFVEAQLPLHHFLVVELKLDVASWWNVDLRLEGFHVLGVGPAESRDVLFGAEVSLTVSW